MGSMRVDPEVKKALEQLEIKDRQFAQFADLLFQKNVSEQYCDFDQLLNVLLRLRPGNQVSVLDFAAFRKGFEDSNKQLIDRMAHLEKELTALDSPNGQLPVPPASTINVVAGTVAHENQQAMQRIDISML